MITDCTLIARILRNLHKWCANYDDEKKKAGIELRRRTVIISS